MAKPTTKAEFKDYIKRKLKAPVLEINVDDDQLDDRVDEALQYFYQYHYEGSTKVYLKHQVTSDQLTTMKTNETTTESASGTCLQ